jgi:hypothetical protein
MHRRRNFALGGATLALAALMHCRRNFALGGATLALALTPAAALAAKAGGGTTVTVRVEGLNRTLLAPTKVTAPRSGFITKGGTPKGKCSATTAAGALDVATHHRWNGKSTSQGLELTSILGETHTFSTKDYWSIWVGDGYAQHGLCGIPLHRGEHLLFAAVPDTFNGSLLALSAPASATAGHAFKVTVYSVSQKGKRTPLAHAHVAGRGVNATTNGRGIARIDPHKSGTLVLQASHAGDIRSAPEAVHVA